MASASGMLGLECCCAGEELDEVVVQVSEEDRGVRERMSTREKRAVQGWLALVAAAEEARAAGARVPCRQ